MDVALGAGARIGRYFNVVSMTPSILLVLYLTGLVAAGAWAGPFDPHKAVAAFAGVGWSQAAVLVAVALVAAIVLQPLQFGAIQVLEGYWGAAPLGLRLMEWRIAKHRAHAHYLKKLRTSAERAWLREVLKLSAEQRAGISASALRSMAELRMNYPKADAVMPDYIRWEAADAALADYPNSFRRIMPTRLGNVLRRYEDTAGSQYGLQAIRIAPHLGYLRDMRQQLDLAVRACVIGGLATICTAVLLADDGLWVFFAFAPYLVSYLGYRGAVAAAHAHGAALSTVIDLGRFTLYERLHLEMPDDSERELAQNATLLQQLSGHELRYPENRLNYRHPGSEPDLPDWNGMSPYR